MSATATEPSWRATTEHGAAALGSNVHLIGGMLHIPASVNPTAATRSVEVFDTTTSKWTDAAPLPISMHHPNVATVDDKIYVLGGTTFTNKKWDFVKIAIDMIPQTTIGIVCRQCQMEQNEGVLLWAFSVN